MVKDVRKVGFPESFVHILATEPSPSNIVELEFDAQHVASEGSLVGPPRK